MKISYRVHTGTWTSDEHFNNLMDLLRKYRVYIDEIALFVSLAHTPMPLEQVKYCAEVGKIRIKAIKELGISCGYNHLCTMGHIDENLTNCLDLTGYDRFQDHLGNIPHILCLNSEKTKEYNRKVYTMLAEGEPDFIWIDDDVRCKGHSGGMGCFCPICMEKFGKIIKVDNLDYNKFNELTKSTAEGYLEIRKAWQKFNEESVDGIIKVIRDACDKVNPNISLGLMSATMEYENDGYMTWTKSMAGKNNVPTKWRPGGGMYKDWNKTDLCVKAHFLGKQTVHYLDNCNDIQSEIENFPYNHLHKSCKMNMLETCAYIGTGCTGVAYNVLLMENYNAEHNASVENERRFRKLLPYKPFYSALTEAFGKNHNKGLYTFENNKNAFLSIEENGEWFKGWKPSSTEIYENGIPCAFKDACVTYLFTDNFKGLEKEEILKILSKGVMLSGKAVKELWRLGYGEYVGFKVGREVDVDAIENFLDHPFNEDAVNMQRDNHQSFWFERAYGFVKTDEKAQYLASLINYSSEIFKDNEGNEVYSMGIYENSLGGRVCVMGYYPDTYVQSLTKSVQLKNVIKYLSKNKIAYVSSYDNALLFDRSGDKIAMLVINNSYDNAENLTVNIPKNIEKIKVLYSDMTEKTVSRLKYVDNYSLFDLGNIPAFEPVLIKE